MQTYPPGSRIGQYEIASLPMMGGMGVVYFALDHGNDGRPVALKTFRPELLPDRAARDRFLREGTTWVELGSHPNIVRCYKVEYFDPTAFLVLELIAKEQNMPDASLRSWLIPGRPLPLEQVLLFALQIAYGMQYATEKIPGFVHRDLKPENILVGADRLPNTNINRLRVTDFGLVKTIAESGISKPISNSEELKPNQIQFTRGVGTPLYMAPEQWKGEPVGVFTDVYAFGCILYEMLNGQRATEGKTITELQASHCDGKLGDLPGDLPHEVRILIRRCLSVRAPKRYQEWDDIVQELERIYVTLTRNETPQKMLIGQTSHDERAQEGSSYNEIGNAYYHIGKLDVAENYFQKSLSIARELGNNHDIGIELGNLGVVYLHLGRYQEALEHSDQNLIIARETNNQRGEIAALGNLGDLHLHLGESQRSIESYEQALRIAREIGYRRGESTCLNGLGNAYKQLGAIQRAIGYYEQALALDLAMEDQRGLGNVLGNLGNAHESLGNAEQALRYYQQQVEITQEIGDRQGESNALGNLGVAYKDLGEMQHAIDLYEKSINIKREIGDQDGESNFLNWLGNAYADLGNPRRAIEYYELALTIQHEIGNQRLEADSLGNLGLICIELGDTSRAIEYYERAITMGRDVRDPNSIAIDTFNLAVLYSQTDDPRALYLTQEAEQLWSQIGSSDVRRAQQLIVQLQGR